MSASAGSPPLARLPPPVPFTVNRKPSFTSQRPRADDVGPPTPPKPSGAPDGHAEPPTGMSQSKSWTQLAPQRPFVNGRGNVQLPGAPQRFIPSTSPTSSSSLVLGPPVRRSPSIRTEGQQAYVRRDPSPGAGSERSGEGRLADSINGLASTMSFPSQFGVTQRVAIRTSSRPQPRSASSAGTPRGSDERLRPNDRQSIQPSLSSHSHLSTSSSSSTSTLKNTTPIASPRSTPQLLPTGTAVTPLAPASASLSAPTASILDRPRPKTPEEASAPTAISQTFVTASSGSRSSAALSSRTIEREGSSEKWTLPPPSPVLERPRSKTPDPFGSLSPVSTTSRTPTVESSTLQRNAAPMSILDRPRPKTPDSWLLFNEERRGLAAPAKDGTRYRPETLDSPSMFSATGGSSDGHSLSRIVMDRPRPRTPDPQGWLDSAATSARSLDTHRSTTLGSSVTSHLESSASSLPYSDSSTSIPISSRPSCDSTGASFTNSVAATGSPLRGYTSSRSRQSTGPSTTLATSTGPPLLDLDFDFGSSFSNSDTLFGLSDLLSFRDPSSATTKATPATVRSRESSSTSDRPAFASTPSSASLLTRTVPRKEAPKVDLKLELELEMERALPTNGSIAESEVRHHRDLSGAYADSERDAGPESGRRTPSGFVGAMGRMRRKGDSISSMRSIVTAGSISEASVGTGGGSPQPVKRRRRRSLASLLSFGSTTGKDQDRDHERDTEQRTRTPEPNKIYAPIFEASQDFAPRSYSPVPLSFEPTSGDLSFDKTLPPTPMSPSHSPVDDRTPPASAVAQRTQYGSGHERTTSGNNALTRQLSRLRQRNEHSSHSPSTSSGSRSGFQVVSGSTTRDRSTRGHGSISSNASSRQTHSTRGDSNEFGYQARGDNALFTALPLSEPASSQAFHAARPSTSSSSSASSIPFGRRLVQRFTGSSSNKDNQAAEAAAVRSWTMPLKDNEQEPARPRKPPRRSSLTSLLNLGDSNNKSVPEKKKPLLGMSLAAGRKSDDMLARGLGREREPKAQWQGSMSDSGHGETYGGRRSFDLLTDREAIPRRPSTDNLLTLASAKLSKMSLADEHGEPLTPSPATPTAPNYTAQNGQLSSGQSTPSVSGSDTAPPVISTAQIVKRSEGSRLQDAESPLLSRTAAPVLVRSDSLRATPQRLPVHEAKPWKKRGKIPDSGVGSDASMSSAWLEIEDTLGLQVVQSLNHPDRAPLLTGTLLPFLKKEEDRPATRTNERLARRQRDILFGWISILTRELAEMQPTHRGACLEGLAGIAESHFLSAATLENDLAGQARYKRAVVSILQFAVEKLNEKAVYANTLGFSGRVFALAFWRIEGVGLKLLRALPQVKRAGLKRILDEAGIDENRIPPVDLDAFPEHLSRLCLQDFRAYTTFLLPSPIRQVEEDDKYLIKDGDVSIEMTGNWLIRWTASDSDLPFSFYRAYHKQLASYLVPIEARDDVVELPPLAPATVITAPGFLLVAASLLEKSDALVHRNLRSVTSMGPNTSNFNTNDSANLSFGAKPKVLELAHRRLVQTMLDIVGGALAGAGESDEETSSAAARRFAFSRMMQVWIRASIKRTSMWDTRSIFILLDYIEALIFKLAFPTSASRNSAEDEPVPSKPDERCLDMFDSEFLFSVVKKILLEADNTVTLMRTIAFLYAHFEIFTLRPSDRTALCEGIILDEAVFTRLFLSYNQGTRGFWIRLLVWRLSRLGVVAKEQNPNLPPDEGILALFGLLNVRLEAIRKRHDQLEPATDLPEDSSFFRPKRSTICSTRGVKEAPWTVDELAEAFEEEAEYEDDPQELVRGVPPPPSSVSSTGGGSTKRGAVDNNKTVSKVVSWLKGGLGKNKKGLKIVPVADNRIEPFAAERSEVPYRPNEAALAQDWPQQTLPTTIETGVVSPSRSAISRNGHLSPQLPQRNRSTSSNSSRDSQRRKSRPTSPAFFSFEFENGVITRTDVDPAVANSAGAPAITSPSSSIPTPNGNPDGLLPTSPIRRTANAHPDPQAAMSPRVSLRFSKRISILPPAALDLLKKDKGGIEAVPPIPAQYRPAMQSGYDKKLHPYAVRGLRDLEDSYDEWTDWVARLQEEEDGGGRGQVNPFMDEVPRLAVSWPTSFTDD
ncbi:uncharacterized protein JCM15063_003129 [Sporobolomyces koalae]|uniref:uncharacterized protein n=1 Tax=Sporobolomyces koalae TaxID=500713 RepID=UPI00317B74F8